LRVPALTLKNIGPLEEAAIQFGGLTVLVGPQGTGKSIFLQILKLMLDAGPILGFFAEHGLNWHKDLGSFLELYLGEGTKGIWQRGSSQVIWQGQHVDLEKFVKSKRVGDRPEETSFLIPAQRVLAFSRDGWFRPFNDYKAGDPFSVRDFSEKLRRLMESDIGRAETIYPQSRRLKPEIEEIISASIFGGFQLELATSAPQKRLVLHGHETEIPFMVWSAGQREVVPLLLGLYRLLPSTKVMRLGSVRWVMIEEMEMGLHPKAIAAMFFIIMELMWRGYRVCLSTHSPQVLDLVWALRNLRELKADPRDVLAIFDVKHTAASIKLAETALKQSNRVYYFDPLSRKVLDISTLDPAADDLPEAGWGGLTELSGKVSDIVARVAAADSSS
jgi:hypothetical protein